MLRHTRIACLATNSFRMFNYAAGIKYCANYELNIPTKVNSYSYVATKLQPTTRAVARPWRYVY
jgi:hypothetical protein